MTAREERSGGFASRHAALSPTTAIAGSGADDAIKLRSVCKSFPTLDTVVVAADHVDLDIRRGSVTALTGPSGSGKSTLLHLIGALDKPDTGSIYVDGTDITSLKPKGAADYRRTIGFVFQRFNLIPTLTVIDNVLIPTLPSRGSRAESRARELLESVGLHGREQTLATRLSGGQQQRVAIARALINGPKIVLADEPTGNLDTATGDGVIDLLFALRAAHGVTLLIATHDPMLARRADLEVKVRDGKILTLGQVPLGGGR